ncbi:HD-GYP domain-containing protein [Lysobacter sp. A3-1-A15]|uniref:HD-GYP domain-containing protein n=1 Tax=Novilysobacter viscosus TaxID=3098602 RepID=UPI002EDB32F9
MRPVLEEELIVGSPLAWPLFDPAGKLLADAGVVVLCEAQRLTLLQRGHVDPALCLVEDAGPTDEASAAAEAPPAPLPPVFGEVRALKRRLAEAHMQLLAAGTPDGALMALELVTELQALVDRDADAALAAVQLDLDDGGPISRQVHAAILCQMATRARGCEPAEVDSMMAAALTYDLALGPIAETLNSQQGELSPEQRRQVEAHPDEAVMLLRAAGVEDPLWLDAVQHHHERLDGSGYPHGLRGDDIGAGARLLAVVDIFSAMVRPRAYREAVIARNALRNLFLERGTAVDAELPGLLVKEIGVFPPGTVVRLASGEVGVVTHRGGNAACPRVARLVNANGTFAAVARSRDTREAEHAIVEAVPQARYQAFLSNCARFWADAPAGRPVLARTAAPLPAHPAGGAGADAVCGLQPDPGSDLAAAPAQGAAPESAQACALDGEAKSPS